MLTQAKEISVSQRQKSNPTLFSAGGAPRHRRSNSLHRLPAIGLRTHLRIGALRQVALLTQLGRETRNFWRRISTTLRARSFERGVDMGPGHHKLADGSYQECSETRARTEDMLRLGTDHPWLTCLDYAVFVEGWNKGAQFRSHSPICGTEPPLERMALTLQREDYIPPRYNTPTAASR